MRGGPFECASRHLFMYFHGLSSTCQRPARAVDREFRLSFSISVHIDNIRNRLSVPCCYKKGFLENGVTRAFRHGRQPVVRSGSWSTARKHFLAMGCRRQVSCRQIVFLPRASLLPSGSCILGRRDLVRPPRSRGILSRKCRVAVPGGQRRVRLCHAIRADHGRQPHPTIIRRPYKHSSEPLWHQPDHVRKNSPMDWEGSDRRRTDPRSGSGIDS